MKLTIMVRSVRKKGCLLTELVAWGMFVLVLLLIAVTFDA
jgi:hypothetical protein